MTSHENTKARKEEREGSDDQDGFRVHRVDVEYARANHSAHGFVGAIGAAQHGMQPTSPTSDARRGLMPSRWAARFRS
jgi:hypothetical protein